MVEESSFSNE
jgi:hypothetical protein